MDSIPELDGEVQKVCHQYSSFDIALRGIGCFPNRRNPRVLWLGLQGDLKRMGEFRNSLQQQLKPFGIKEEKRDFRPHLTLGRFRKPNKISAQLDQILSLYEDITSSSCTLKELNLFKSDLKPEGASYTKLKTWPLSGNR